MATMRDLSSWFWSDNFWLPPNVTWATFDEHKLANSPEIRFAQYDELLTPVLAAVIVIVIKAVAQGIFRRIGIAIGLKVKAHGKQGTPN